MHPIANTVIPVQVVTLSPILPAIEPETNANIPRTKATTPDRRPAFVNDICSSSMMVSIIGPIEFQIRAIIIAPE